MSTSPQQSSRSLPVPALLIGLGVLLIIGYLAWTMLGSNGDTAMPAPSTDPPAIETAEPTPTEEPDESEPESASVDASEAAPAKASETAAVTTTEPSASPEEATREMGAVDPETAALDQLTAYAEHYNAIIPKNSQWVAQLSSKYVGVSDPLLTAANGTHTFYASDIATEFEQIASNTTSVQVVLLDSRDFGTQQLIDGKNLWVTFGLSDAFTSEDDVLDWCAGEFPYLEGRERLNVCMPNRLRPPGA